MGAKTDVTAFMAGLDHPRKADIEALRAIMLGADPRVRESIKWNAPSYAITEHFATFKFHPRETIEIVFHTGAKGKAALPAVAIEDPAGLLRWVAPDRALAAFADLPDIIAKTEALVAVVRQWIAQAEDDRAAQ